MNGKALTKSYVQTRQRLERWLFGVHALDLQAAARESFLLGDAAIRRWSTTRSCRTRWSTSTNAARSRIVLEFDRAVTRSGAN